MSERIPVDERVAVDSATVAALIAEQFPRFSHLPVKPVLRSGWDNHTLHLGDFYKVRLPASSVYLSQTEKETTWLPRLAPHLPFAIPVPVAVGKPAHGYPFPWSIWQWIDGEPASPEVIGDLGQFAEDVAHFLKALAQCDTEGAPPASAANFFRAGNLAVYDAQTRSCLAKLSGVVDTDRLGHIWKAALRSRWTRPAVWVHGDIASGNLLVRDGRLHAVIDFGSSAVGDPACDLVINWTMFDVPARRRFRTHYPADADTWARARGWCIWKAMLVLSENLEDLDIARREKAVLDAVLSDCEA
ncbi:aminoglycoside phosphotransferase family protein [Rhizobium leucaenae]|uniref:Aminoglycoside phosphotransferase (APT) family kinase protein n=1 Tax=Rhizobium leucaenae TaxID=29450 RepID=A0A7W7EMI2_9HYPH|nr:aminoglycoside phosphotransferase family protein [Rhizobium leucaenae]MBB4571126.1 aminoglycoside phosphotransferase (APT) family kinase protein [Rhizobium leucaenae]MBB6304220.1 aminoglycoside phosphotransferase (APT) family kinase protein [Rhizobium leucaenae]